MSKCLRAVHLGCTCLRVLSLELCLGADETSLVRYSSYRSNDHYQRQRVLQKERAIVSREARHGRGVDLFQERTHQQLQLWLPE